MRTGICRSRNWTSTRGNTLHMTGASNTQRQRGRRGKGPTREIGVMGHPQSPSQFPGDGQENQNMTKNSVVLAFVLLASVAWTQDHPKKYPWQNGGDPCTERMTFCWYGSEIVSDPEVTAYGNRWVTQDKDERPLEWVTEVRCIQKNACLHSCSQPKDRARVTHQHRPIRRRRVERLSNSQCWCRRRSTRQRQGMRDRFVVAQSRGRQRFYAHHPRSGRDDEGLLGSL